MDTIKLIGRDLKEGGSRRIEIRSRNILKTEEKPRKTSTRIVDVPAGVRTAHFPNKGQKRYRFGDLVEWQKNINTKLK
jgi:hypothetical protein